MWSEREAAHGYYYAVVKILSRYLEVSPTTGHRPASEGIGISPNH